MWNYICTVYRPNCSTLENIALYADEHIIQKKLEFSNFKIVETKVGHVESAGTATVPI